jgi:NADH-quinone oxidoreductase subunit G
MEQIATQIPDYSEVTYEKVSAVVDQWPIIGRSDLYYGGTTYENSQGLGYQLQPAAQKDQPVSLEAVQLEELDSGGAAGLMAVPVTVLYDHGQMVIPADLLHQRIPEPYVVVHPESIAHLGLIEGAHVRLDISGIEVMVVAHLDETIPQDVLLVPRSLGVPIHEPTPVKVALVEPVVT